MKHSLCGYKVVFFFAWKGVYNVTAYAVATSSVLHILYWVPLITSQQADASFVCMNILHVLQDLSPHGTAGGFEDAQYCFCGVF